MQILNANVITDELVSRIGQIRGGADFPFSIALVARGRFYEDLADDAALPVATVVPSSSDPVQGQQMQASAQRVRQYQVEVVFDLDDYPGLERDVVMTNVEWCLGKALGGVLNNRALGGKALAMTLGGTEYGWPAVGASLATLTALIAITYIEQYQ